MKLLFIVYEINSDVKKTIDALKLFGPDNLQLDVTDYSNIAIELGSVNDFHIWHKEYDLNNYDYIYLRNWKDNQVIAAVIAQYCELNKIQFDDEHLLKIRDDCKLLQATLFAINGIPIPLTLFYTADLIQYKYQEIKKKLGDQFILKDAQSNRGKNNYLIKNKLDFEKIVLNIRPGELYICQKFIINNFEYRYLTFGGKVEVVMKRSQPKGSTTHKNNAHGMIIEYITDKSKWIYQSWTEKISKNIMEREILGVDYLIEAETGKPYILEANPAPGIISHDKESIIKAEKFLEYITKEVSKNKK